MGIFLKHQQQSTFRPLLAIDFVQKTSLAPLRQIKYFGNKGYFLRQLIQKGAPVPPGFILTTCCYRQVMDRRRLTTAIKKSLLKYLKDLEQITGLKYADAKKPLILSVRSGAAVSMPGMMETILNIGLNDKTVEGLALLKNQWCAFDSYRRLLEMFGTVVFNIPVEEFIDNLVKLNIYNGKKPTLETLKKLVNLHKRIFTKYKKSFPQNLKSQLEMAIIAVFNSWNSTGAVNYRVQQGISHLSGTAVYIMQMVFGNAGQNSESGVVFTRDVKSGVKKHTGSVQINAQGEDVVSGFLTPRKLTFKRPAYRQSLIKAIKIVEKLNQDVVWDIEYTVDNRRVFILQARKAKLSSKAKLRLISEKSLKKKDFKYLKTLTFKDIKSLQSSRFQQDARQQAKIIGHGLSVSPNVGRGQVAKSVNKAKDLLLNGVAPVLYVSHIKPDNIDIVFTVAKSGGAIVTSKGGPGSHMAIIMRNVCCPAIVGAGDFKVKEGQVVSVDGQSGNIYDRRLPLALKPSLSRNERRIINQWTKLFGSSNWSNFLYQHHNRRPVYQKVLNCLTMACHKTSSQKAQVMMLINSLFPKDFIIRAQVFRPGQFEEIEKVMYRLAKENYSLAPRSGWQPKEILAGAPWNFVKKEQIKAFVYNQGFKGSRPEYGGLQNWIKRSLEDKNYNLESVIISAEPPGKMDPFKWHQHLAITVTASTPNQIVVDINPFTPMLRSLEKVDPKNKIQIIVCANQQSHWGISPKIMVFGQNHFKNKKNYHQYLQPMLKGQINDQVFEKLINKQVLNVTKSIGRTIFTKWWQDKRLLLPYTMSCLAEICHMETLEIQARMTKSGKLKWILIYGLKGREEQQAIKAVKT